MDKYKMNRRSFLRYTTSIAAGTSFLGGTSSGEDKKAELKWKKALKITMLAKELPDAEKFKLAKKCGFDGIDARPLDDMDKARKQAELARKAGVEIHGLVFGGWHAPLSDPDPKVVQKGIEGMESALRCAKVMGATTVLLVPAIVTEKVRYADAYNRSQDNIRKLLPVAEETGIVIAIENVWNKFLLSPLEFARYLDELDSVWVRAYFDVGNVVIFGYPQDWIRTLDHRIIKVDLKDFKRKGYKWTNLRDGDVDWPAVHKALTDIGFEGYMTAELRGGDEKYLCDMSNRIDRIFAGK